MLDAKASIVNSRVWVRGWIREVVRVVREEDDDEGCW